MKLFIDYDETGIDIIENDIDKIVKVIDVYSYEIYETSPDRYTAVLYIFGEYEPRHIYKKIKNMIHADRDYISISIDMNTSMMRVSEKNGYKPEKVKEVKIWQEK